MLPLLPGSPHLHPCSRPREPQPPARTPRCPQGPAAIVTAAWAKGGECASVTGVVEEDTAGARLPLGLALGPHRHPSLVLLCPPTDTCSSVVSLMSCVSARFSTPVLKVLKQETSASSLTSVPRPAPSGHRDLINSSSSPHMTLGWAASWPGPGQASVSLLTRTPSPHGGCSAPVSVQWRLPRPTCVPRTGL